MCYLEMDSMTAANLAAITVLELQIPIQNENPFFGNLSSFQDFFKTANMQAPLIANMPESRLCLVSCLVALSSSPYHLLWSLWHLGHLEHTQNSELASYSQAGNQSLIVLNKAS